MEAFTASPGMLDLVSCPAFSVYGGIIEYANSSARSLCIVPGIPAAQLIHTGSEEYAALDGGCLSVTVSVNSHRFGAFVSSVDGRDIFLLDQQEDDPRQVALALASVSLRNPLSTIMSALEHFSMNTEALSPEGRKMISRLTQGAFQLHRQVSNMSDAIPYAQETPTFRLLDAKAVIDEILEKAGAMLSHTKAKLHYTGLEESVLTAINRDKLERAIYNLLSNAVQWLGGPGNIDVNVSSHVNKIMITVTDDGRGMSDETLRTVFYRYQRRPAMDNLGYGIGLGMSLVRSAAAAHGGTVLLQRRDPKGTRVTMTLAIRQGPEALLKAPLLPYDYAGGYDHALLELSDILPPELYQ